MGFHCLRIGEDFPERDNAAVIIPALIFVYPYPVSAGNLAACPPWLFILLTHIVLNPEGTRIRCQVQNLITAPARSS
jgi:hypothetical protein